MSKAIELMKGEMDKPLGMQTISNRDLVNRLYFARYEDCIDALSVKNEVHWRDNFLILLKKLYWSFIMPRKHIDDEMGVSDADFKDVDLGMALLTKIGRKMYEIGINKTEKTPIDPAHGFVEEEEVVE